VVLELFRKTKSYAHLRIAQGLIWYEYNFDCVFPVFVIDYRKTGKFCGHSFPKRRYDCGNLVSLPPHHISRLNARVTRSCACAHFPWFYWRPRYSL